MNLIERVSPLWRDRSGVAAVEFALAMPVMLMIYLGIVQLVQAVMADLRVAQVSATVTSMVTQYTSISASTQMPDILGASAQIMTPYPAGSGGIVVSLITIDGSGKATVTWSQGLNATSLTAGQAMTLPAALDIPNTCLVLGQATYLFSPVIDYLGLGKFPLSASVYMSPRNATTINLEP